MTKILFIGDVHGTFDVLDMLYDEFTPDYIVQCGDFGIWNKYTHSLLRYSGKAPVYFIRGNHENHDWLDELYGTDNGISAIHSLEKEFTHAKNVFLCNSGTILKLGSKKILMLGGADSIDKERRLEGKSWWRQEIPSKECQKNVLSADYKDVDIVVSHTSPLFVQNEMDLPPPPNRFTSDPNYHDPTTNYLEECYNYIKSKENKLNLWLYGHFHMPFRYETKECDFIALNAMHAGGGAYIPSEGYYHILEV